MVEILKAVNWEQVGVVVVSVLSSYGVTRSWLNNMCSKIESTNLRVEEHRDEIRAIVAEMKDIIRKEGGK